ncbi:CheR family methyltransferase [Salipiger aestuarii]|uniref:CheR family methyltransferase n=1 Tax=Salipiger aestuarii TaxID=568098 RepID=UPI001CC329EC|nr:CheR family methyltransferase [Salipiger aestuarii]
MSEDAAPNTGPASCGTIPVVAIGASAGGLVPLEDFFRTAPADAGWCYIVIQHLSPDYRSVMDEVLGRKTRMRIMHIQDGLEIAPNTIYLNRPNTRSTLDYNTFRTSTYTPEDHVPHLPIDSMFASLASRGGDRTAAVILSGAGRDGANGAQILHAAGGALLVQAPQDADFPSMPRAALALGIHDRIASAARLADDIREIFDTGQRASPPPDAGSEPDITAAILELLEKQHHLDFGSYKEINVQRRILRRRALRGIDDPRQYLDLLMADPDAVNELYQDLLIGVTHFYRDPEAIALLRTSVIEPLVDRKSDHEIIRVWVAGCASGEEAYTIAIELNEAMEKSGNHRSFRIIATDVHRQSIDQASTGTYSEQAVRRVPQHLRDKYFTRKGNLYAVAPVLRQRIIFSVHDALSDPPFLDLDLVSCRNLLIYLRDKSQARVISMFSFGLRRHGALLLGPSETLGRFHEQFQVVNARWRLFRKATDRRLFDSAVVSRNTHIAPRSHAPHAHNDDSIPTPKPQPRLSPMLREFADMRGREAMLRAYDVLLKRYTPASLLVTSDSEVLSWFGAASVFVDTRSNLTDWSVEHILHRDLHFVINVALEKLRSGDFETFSRRVEIELGEMHPQAVTLTFEPLDRTSKPGLMLIRIRLEDGAEQLPAAPADQAGEEISSQDAMLLARRVHELERDLRLTEETLQHVTERLEASGEELQASNEELQASNEELQASNEELQSANEELHAVNEALVAVSAEHEHKIVELSSLNAETEQLLDRLNTGVIVVDEALLVKRFSGLVARLFSLEPHDVNRKLSVIGPRFSFIDLTEATRSVLETNETIIARGLCEGRGITIEVRSALDDHGNGTGAFVIFRPED